MIKTEELEKMRDSTKRDRIYNQLLNNIDSAFFKKLTDYSKIEENLSINNMEVKFDVVLKDLPESHQRLMREAVENYYSRVGLKAQFAKEKITFKEMKNYVDEALRFAKRTNYKFDKDDSKQNYYVEIAKNISETEAKRLCPIIEEYIDEQIIEMTFYNEEARDFIVPNILEMYEILAPAFQEQVVKKINKLYSEEEYSCKLKETSKGLYVQIKL